MARNALVAASHMIVRVQDSLERMFPEQDILFEAAPGSTFTPTRHDANVPNINTVPGRDVFYLDCRVLPCHDVQDARDRVRMVLEEIALENGVDVLVDVVQAQQAPPAAPLNSALVRSLERNIRRIYRVEPRPVGSGGGTVAGEARALGISAVAWSKAVPAYHEPNEHSSIANTIGDAQVMAAMLFDAE
jgi:succinyl-diaminopimelate desuccinylase